MPKGMDEKKAAAEAVLFASGEPVALSRIADALDVSQETAQELLESLRQEYDGEKQRAANPPLGAPVPDVCPSVL